MQQRILLVVWFQILQETNSSYTLLVQVHQLLPVDNYQVNHALEKSQQIYSHKRCTIEHAMNEILMYLTLELYISQSQIKKALPSMHNSY